MSHNLNLMMGVGANGKYLWRPPLYLSCIYLVVGPRILPNSISPIGDLLPSPSTVWSMMFDQSVSVVNHLRI